MKMDNIIWRTGGNTVYNIENTAKYHERVTLLYFVIDYLLLKDNYFFKWNSGKNENKERANNIVFIQKI